MSATEGEKFLKAFHSKHPGCTSQTMSSGLNIDGKSSYDLLTDVVPRDTTQSLTVLDLACGDGFLLSLLQRRNQPRLRLIGIDMSDGELALARQRLSPPIELHQGMAQTIPLSDASVDIVLCHMALMLMDSVENVITEIKRVLKPGGKFSAVVGGKRQRTSTNDIFIALLNEALKSEGNLVLPSLGDSRVRQDEGTRSLFSSGFEQPITLDEHVITVNGSLDLATKFFMLYYDSELLSPNGRRALGQNLRESLEQVTDEKDRVACAMGLRQITCTKVLETPHAR